MSFSRSKINRFSENEAKPIKLPTNGNSSRTSARSQRIENQTSPTTPRVVLVKTSQKPRSLSQPANNTSCGRNTPRSHSGGDETRISQNAKKAENSLVSEHSEIDLYASATMIKSAGVDEPDADQIMEGDGQLNNTPSCKASSSGIPLRIKQQQTSAPVSTKPSPRMSKPSGNVTTIHSPVQKRVDNNAKVAGDPQKRVSTAMSKRTLETLFQTKKKKLEHLKKELYERQRPLMDEYVALIQMKKKLETVGKTVILEEIKLLECKNLEKSPRGSSYNLTGAGEQLKAQHTLQPDAIQQMHQTINQIPESVVQICKALMVKRSALVHIVEKLQKDNVSEEEGQKTIRLLKDEGRDMEAQIQNAIAQQSSYIKEVLNKWEILAENSAGNNAYTDQIIELEQKLMQREAGMDKLANELQLAKDKHYQEIETQQQSALDLKEKMNLMEDNLQHERNAMQESKDKFGVYDLKIKQMKTKIKESETKQKEAESKLCELQKLHRQTQEQIRLSEHRWAKEKEEFQSKSKHDRQILDKLTKDRSYFETRVKTLEDMVEDNEVKGRAMQVKCNEQIEAAKNSSAEDKAQKDSMQLMYDGIKNQLVQMEIRNKQAIDLVHSKNTFEPNETEGISTEREAELYTELLATRVALKAAEDQIQNYNREKLRFIDSIQSLQGDQDKDQDYIAKTLVKNVEKITELETKLSGSEENVSRQRIEIANLIAEIENLRQRTPSSMIFCEEKSAPRDNDLKMMLHEGRVKLEQSLKKTLEYEHKLIRYEHDMNRQTKQLYEMENLLKVRDGLITMIKAKKDELQMENDSLNKYAHEVRDLLIQAKEEARNRTELVQELSTNLDTRGRTCQQLEKKVKELEGSLSATNRKRFKLQDTIGVMEKELQTTKANYNKLVPDLQSRYATTSNVLTPTKHDPDANATTQPYINTTELLEKNSSMSIIFSANAERGEELDMWMNYYHEKLNCLKQSFKVASEEIFDHEITKTKESNGKECPPTKLSRVEEVPEETDQKYSTHPIENIQPSIITKNNLSNCVNNYKTYKRTLLVNPDKTPIDTTELTIPSDILITFKNMEMLDRIRNESQDNEKANINMPISDVHGVSGVNMEIPENIVEEPILQHPFSTNEQIPRPQPQRSSSSTKQLRTHEPHSRPTTPNIHRHTTFKKVISKSGSESSVSRKKLKLDSNINSVSRNVLTERTKFINHANNISYHLNKVTGSKYYIPKLLSGISQYKVMHSAGSVVWCKPSTEMEVNSVLISRDLMAHSLNKIHADLTTTISLLSKNLKIPKSSSHSKKSLKN